ncbi:MAG: TetR/AcrR family transcriptional regulator [Pseudomonadota bacterium]
MAIQKVNYQTDTEGRPARTAHAKQTFLNLPDEKRGRILAAATDEFSHKGFERASINAIVASVGIAKGSIYQYFPDKKGLFLYTFEAAVSLIRATLKKVKADSEDLDFFERLRLSLLTGFQFTRRHPRIYAAYLRILFGSDTPMREDLVRVIRLFSANYLRTLAEEGLRRGELRPDMKPAHIAFFLDAVMDRMLQAYAIAGLDFGLGLHGAQAQRTEEWVNLFIDFIRRGLASPETRNQTALT